MNLNENKNLSLIFSEEFICPNCHFSDKGKFCKNCGETFFVSKENILKVLSFRFENIGFQEFKLFKSEYLAIVTRYKLDKFYQHDWELFCRIQPIHKKFKLDLIVFIKNDENDNENVDNIINEMIDDVSGIFFVNKNEFRDEFIKSLKITFLKIEKNKDKENSFLRIKKNTSKNIFSWNLMNLFTDTGEVYSPDNGFFNLVEHQVRAASKQIHFPNPSTFKKNKIIDFNFFSDKMGGFVEYFKLIICYITNPYVFSNLFICKKFLSVLKAINFYFLGLVCSIFISFVFSRGRLNESDLTAFSNFNPLISDAAELVLEVIGVFFFSLFLHLVIRAIKHNGNFWALFIGVFFIQGFLQIVNRPLFSSQVEMSMLTEANQEFEYGSFFLLTTKVFIFIFLEFYFLSPLLFNIYGVSKRFSAFSVIFSIFLTTFFYLLFQLFLIYFSELCNGLCL
jgi:hypothetical protein